MMATRMEAIVADGKVFVGSYAGKMHALDGGNGSELWTFTTENQAAIAHSPAVSGNTLVFGTVDGKIYGLDISTGSKLWDFTAHGPGGFLTSPSVYNGIVYMGSQDGWFYAVNLDNGSLLWEKGIGAAIVNTAAVADGVVYFGGEDMHAYALNANTGAQLWKSAKFYGMSMRDYYPVIAQDVVFFTTNPPEEFFDITHPENAFLCDTGGGSDEHDAILSYIASNPHHKVFYALRRSDGQEKFQAPVFYQAGCQGVMTPPTVLADGTVMLNYRTFDSVYQGTYHNTAFCSGGGYTEYRAIGSLDLNTGRIEQFYHAYGNTQSPWSTGWWPQGDETQILSSGGNILYNTHQGNPAGMDLEDGTMFPLPGGRDTWGGHVRPTWAGNEWHGVARGSISISGSRVYWIVGSRVIAIQGQ